MPKGLGSERWRPKWAWLEATVMRISITVACVAVIATSTLFSGRANGASEERRIEDRLAGAKNRIDNVMLRDADAKDLIKRSRVYIARAETALANHHSAFAGSLS